METKPLNDSDSRLQCANREKNIRYRNGSVQIWARIEKRNRRHLGRMGNIKKAQNHKYHDSEESRKEMDVEKPKRCSEDRN